MIQDASSNSDNTEASCVPGSTTCGMGACQRLSSCANDQVSCTPGSPPTETCNNIDDDCDGSVDEGNVCNPDSCSDTDGGIAPLVMGTVSGYLNGNSYSLSDFCIEIINATALDATMREYYCTGTSRNSQVVNCTVYGKTSCSNGACA